MRPTVMRTMSGLVCAATIAVVLTGCSGTADGAARASAASVTPAATVIAEAQGHVAGRVGERCTSGGGMTRPTSSPAPEYVEAFAGSSSVATAQVDPDGNYYLTLQPGRYVLHQGDVVGDVTVTAGALSLMSFFCGRALAGTG